MQEELGTPQSSIAIRLANNKDRKAIADLLDSLDRYYGDGPEERANRLRNIDLNLFSSVPVAFALLAWEGSTLVGMASYSLLWPAIGSTRSLYLKELYVDASMRRRGIGRRLLDEILKIAQVGGCSRVEWTTDADNDSARLFYEALGTAQKQEKIFYRVVDL